MLQRIMHQGILSYSCSRSFLVALTSFVLLFHCPVKNLNTLDKKYCYVYHALETVQILIRWLHQKPSDLDLHCFLNKINFYGYSRKSPHVGGF